MVRIKQEWWHVEDKWPSSKVFRHVMDIYTNEQFLKYQTHLFFIKLKGKSRFKPNELEFIQKDDFIEINLGDLEKYWPSAPEPDEKLKHVKLEVEYTDINTWYEQRKKLKIIPWFGYDTSFGINGATQPEFYIILPLGMKLVEKGKNAKLLLERREKISVPGGPVHNIPLKTKLFFENIHEDKVDGKNAYSFLIKDDSYQLLKSTRPEDVIFIEVFYDVTHEAKFGFFPVFPIALLLFGFLEYYLDPTLYAQPDAFVVSLTYVIIFISFFIFYITLLKEGYEIPWNKFTIAFTSLAAILSVIPQMIPCLINNLISPICHLILYWI